MVGQQSVICGCSATVMDKGREVSILDTSGRDASVWFGYEYKCSVCGKIVITNVSGVFFLPGDKEYVITRDKGEDYRID